MQARRAAMILVLTLLALALPLALSSAGGVRLAGVGLLWWYCALIAPLAAVLVTVASLSTSSSPRE